MEKHARKARIIEILFGILSDWGEHLETHRLPKSMRRRSEVTSSNLPFIYGQIVCHTILFHIFGAYSANVHFVGLASGQHSYIHGLLGIASRVRGKCDCKAFWLSVRFPNFRMRLLGWKPPLNALGSHFPEVRIYAKCGGGARSTKLLYILSRSVHISTTACTSLQSIQQYKSGYYNGN